MSQAQLPPNSRRQQYLPLALLVVSSALSVTLSLARIWYSDTRHYIFMNWNLLLAWSPLLLAYLLWRLDAGRGLRQAPGRSVLMLLIFGCWLLFFPNSPYILSDLIHINPRDNVPVWYDAMMVFSYAWNGLVLGFVSLWLVQQLTARWFGRAASWLFVTATLTATGFGIYLGRFQRWNSWDVLVDPLGMARQVLVYALNPLDHPRTVGVTLLFGGFLTVAYLTVTLLPGAMKALAQESDTQIQP
jgi:uncharacterized membrane protein